MGKIKYAILIEIALKFNIYLFKDQNILENTKIVQIEKRIADIIFWNLYYQLLILV